MFGSQAPVILNSQGKPIVLNAIQKHSAKWLAKSLWEKHGPVSPALSNSLGYEVAITTLTSISQKISEQKMYMIPFADYVPVRVGDAPFSTNITTYRSFDVADAFETGIINTGGQNARLASTDAAVDALNIKVFPWAKSIGYSIFDLEFAAKSGNWDLVSAKQKAAKRNWDLGLQRIAFLGANGQNGAGGQCLGLLNQAGITVNNTVIPQALSAMSSADLKVFTSQIISVYQINNGFTAMPSHFGIPQSDYNGLTSQSSPQFPIKSTLELLLESFKAVTMNPNFKILPIAYADKAQSGFAYQIYALYNFDDESIRMDVPLQYTVTLPGTLDNFGFQSAAYGQFTGVLAYRPLEMMYFTY